ncbi:hypothetical protein [Microbacterium gorillae]|uniref:hypothetical protein n=1 Tax=Microbacterium gorillae TaxID=1231063 RepID=UPI00058E9681|nr:hypothetical protein [Microbacterium gorillae]
MASGRTELRGPPDAQAGTDHALFAAIRARWVAFVHDPRRGLASAAVAVAVPRGPAFVALVIAGRPDEVADPEAQSALCRIGFAASAAFAPLGTRTPASAALRPA